MSKKNKSSKHKICCFCRSSQNNELEFGKFYKDGNIVTHYYCLVRSFYKYFRYFYYYNKYYYNI